MSGELQRAKNLRNSGQARFSLRSEGKVPVFARFAPSMGPIQNLPKSLTLQGEKVILSDWQIPNNLKIFVPLVQDAYHLR